MSLLSVFLDETGFLAHVAALVAKRAGKSQFKVFVAFYATISLMTVFTSNDVVILTFTPFICKFAKRTKIDATPFVVSEFVAANSWSMLFLIGNPTNVYLTCASGIDFISYLSVMWLTTILCGVASFLTLYLIFRKRLKAPLDYEHSEQPIKDKTLAIVCGIVLGVCTVLVAVSSYIGLEMWLVSFVCCVTLYLFAGVYSIFNKGKGEIVLSSLKRTPWQMIPLVIGMFVVVLALVNTGATEKAAALIGGDMPILRYGVLSTLSANLVNNIPMSVLFSSIINSADATIFLKAVYSTVIGSNIGAFLTPLGALAGLMFLSIVKDNGVKMTFSSFVKYGVPIATVSLLFALVGLFVVLG